MAWLPLWHPAVTLLRSTRRSIPWVKRLNRNQNNIFLSHCLQPWVLDKFTDSLKQTQENRRWCRHSAPRWPGRAKCLSVSRLVQQLRSSNRHADVAVSIQSPACRQNWLQLTSDLSLVSPRHHPRPRVAPFVTVTSYFRPTATWFHLLVEVKGQRLDKIYVLIRGRDDGEAEWKWRYLHQL